MTTATLAQTAYKPKTAIIQPGEKIEPDEFYGLKSDGFLFHGRLYPGDSLTMRVGCLAEIGDLVQLAYKPTTIDNIAIYQPGIKYTAVCVAVWRSTDWLTEKHKQDDKDWWHVEYVVNGVKKYSPWFNRYRTAYKAQQILQAKYGDDLGVYRDPRPGNKTTGWKPKEPYLR